MIEKMKFVNIIGPKAQLDPVVERYLSRYEIQLENAMGELKELKNITPCADNNPYREAADRAAKAAAFVGDGPEDDRDMETQEAQKIIDDVCARLQEAEAKTKEMKEELKKKEILLEAASPYRDLHFDLSKILHFKEVKFRFGKLPKGYYERLKTYVYDDACTIFEKCREDEFWVWGVYFAPASEVRKVDAIYASMHFERIYLEDAYEGTVDEACRQLEAHIGGLKDKIGSADDSLKKELQGRAGTIRRAAREITAASRRFDIRRLAAFTRAKTKRFSSSAPG